MSIKEHFAQEPIYLMDASAFIYRGFYANQSMQRSDGFPTSALFIIARVLLRILREEQPKNFIFILDGPGKNFRHDIFPLYKSQRSGTPEALIQQLEPIKRLVQALGIPIEISKQCEADDCIASLAKQYRNTHPIILIATDKDLKQCLHENVLMWDPATKGEKIVTLESFIAEEGVHPSQWPDVQAIIGDSSDNIPGVPGIGKKTAAQLFSTLDSLEAIRDNIENLPQKIQNKLQGHLESIFLYRKLTTLQTNQCQHIQLKDLQLHKINPSEAITVLREFELMSLEREVLSFTQKDVPSSIHDPEEKNSEQYILFSQPKTQHTKSCREIQTIPSLENSIVAILYENNEVALALDGTEYLYTGPLNTLVEQLIHAQCIITPNVKYLLHANPLWSVIPISRWFDLGLATYLLDPEERDYGWPKLSARWSSTLGLSQANPALIALSIWDHLYKRLQGAGLLDLMKNLEIPLIPILTQMESAGIILDDTALTNFLIEVQDKLTALTQTIYEEAGETFNIRSAQQLGDILFHKLNLPTTKKTRGGQESTSQEVLEKLSGHHTIVNALLEYRKLEKLRSTYLEPLPRLMDTDGRIRTTFNQLATATGRLSSSNPNLQNIPIRGPLGQRMRSCFTSSKEHLLVSADYSQIELRVLAHFSNDPTLVQSFHEGADIHTRTASLLYEKNPEDISIEERRNAKTINFGLIYGMGPQKLAQELNTSTTKAKEFISKYFERLQHVKKFYEYIDTSAKEHGYVTTLAGRRRLLPDIRSTNTQMQSLARRQAINTVIQGSAADIIKIAMLTVYADSKLKTMDAKLLLQVHDELVIEVKKEYAQNTGEHVAFLMSNVQPGVNPLTVPLTVEWGVGHTWNTAH